jgi:Trk K+ transport system NAD-binding subunit
MFPSEETILEMGDELFIIGIQEAVEKVVSEIGQES